MATKPAYVAPKLNVTLPLTSVLVLDDDRAYSEAVAKNLELLGAKVSTASSAAEARKLLQENLFQVIITDVALGDNKITGDEFIVESQRLMKGADVVVVTAHPARHIKRLEELESLGVRVIEKRPGFVESLREVIDAHQVRFTEEARKSHSRPIAAAPAETERVAARRLRVFLCHASNDKPAVRGLYQRLRQNEFDPWLDEEDLLPGHEWEREIKKAVRGSDIVVVCLSQQSINKRGFVQKELRIALDVADEQPEGTIFIIPVKLEECEVPERLRRWQWVNLFEDRGYQRLVRALEAALASLQKVEG